MLLANVFAQGEALAFGKTPEEVRRRRLARLAGPASDVPGQPAVQHASAAATHARGARPLVALYEHMRVHAGRDLERRLVRPVGRGAGQGAGAAHHPGARAAREPPLGHDSSTNALIRRYRQQPGRGFEAMASHETGTGDEPTHTPTRSCSSGRRAIWPTRRSFPRCRRWPSAATSMCQSSAWPRPAGRSTSCARGRRTASRSTAASTERRSTSCAGCFATSTGTTKIRRPSRRSGRRSAAHSTPRTTWRSRPRSSARSWSSWLNPDARRGRASSSRNPSARTSPRRAS